MLTFGKKIVKFRIPILIIAFLLLIPSVIGMANTRVNYDILSYLPSNIDTMKGQNIMTKEFGKGAFSMYMVEGMSDQDVSSLKKKIEKVKNVDSVIWYDTFLDTSIPKEILPSKLYNTFNSDDTTMMVIIFKTGTSADATMQAVNDIRDISNEQCFLSGMSAFVTDTRQLTQNEEPIYVGIAVALSALVLALFMDSFAVPFIFLGSIGMAILYNLGTNAFLGDVSYITKALAAVLQLGVTMDYSIFLWHAYKESEEKYVGDRETAMAHAIKNTVVAVAGSSLTTIAGFIALCFMSFTLGTNLGLVMAKGVVFGVIACVTILPALILVFDKVLDKTAHRPLMPNFDHLAEWIIDHYKVFIIIFVLLIVPAYIGQKNTKVYYDLSSKLPKDLPAAKANTKLNEDFDKGPMHMILVSSDLSQQKVRDMCEDMEDVKGVNNVISMDSLLGSEVPDSVVPEKLVKIFKSKNYQMILIDNKYKVATSSVNKEINKLQTIVKKYDSKGMVIGEAPCTKDLIDITDVDFQNVSIASIAAIFVIIMLTLRSISLPVVLVSLIEVAIFINMGIPYYTGVTLPFIASVVIGTIQLGATVDYAILMTTRFRKERRRGVEKKEAVTIALKTSIPSVIVSGMSFFASTFGVGLYSNIDMISALCRLMARGAVISTLMVIFILPCLFMVFDKLINYQIIKKLKKEAVLQQSAQ